MIWEVSRRLALAGVAGVCVWLAGCAAAPVADDRKDAAAKQFQAPPGRGVIYVYRHERFAADKPMPVYFNGRFMGNTHSLTYFRWPVEPGEHRLRSSVLGDDVLILRVESGSVYYVWQEIRMEEGGLSARLHQVSAERGRQAVLQCRLLTAGL